MDEDLRKALQEIWDRRQRDEITDAQATEAMERAREQHRNRAPKPHGPREARPRMGAVDRRRVFDRVVDACAQASGITRYELLRRERWSAHPRQIAMYLVREITGATMMQVSGLFDRDHSTVVYARSLVVAELARGHGRMFEITTAAIAILQQRRGTPRPVTQKDRP